MSSSSRTRSVITTLMISPTKLTTIISLVTVPQGDDYANHIRDTLGGIMRKLPSTLKWQHYALVVGRDLPGLFDCMRYDHATFFQEVDSSIAYQAFYRPSEEFRIVITAFTETKTPPWSGKWASCHIELTPIGDGGEYQIERGLANDLATSEESGEGNIPVAETNKS